LLLNVSNALRTPGERFAFIHHEHIAPQDINGEMVTFDVPVVVEGHYSMFGTELTLEGTIKATAHSRCCNCLEPAVVNLLFPFHEVFTHEERYVPSPADDNGEECLQFSGYNVDLEQITFTLTMLEMPIRILCRPDCDGYKMMAPQYTQERDQANDNPFAALGKLLNNDLKDQEV